MARSETATPGADEKHRVAGTQDYEALVRPDGLVHRSIFTDPTIFDREMTQIFGGTWTFLCHEGEIPNVNDFTTTILGRRPIIVTRLGDGSVQALVNRCTHRGARICEALSGNAGRFQCPYHGWTFGNNGELLSVTFADGYGPQFAENGHNLGRLPRLEIYRGHVFGSLNPDVEPLEEWLGPAREVFDWAVDASDPKQNRVVKCNTVLYRGNWKLQNDNNADLYHAPFTHRSTLMMTKQRHGAGMSLDHFKGDQTPMCAKYFGKGHKMIDQRPSFGVPWRRARPVPGRESYASQLAERLGDELSLEYLNMTGRVGVNLVLYPNLFIMGGGAYSVYEPVSVNETIVHSYILLRNDAPEEVNILRARFAEDFFNVLTPDDNEIFERVQNGLERVPEMPWVDFSKGLGTNRETVSSDGVVTGNASDETGIRGSYMRWKELMTADIETTVIT